MPQTLEEEVRRQAILRLMKREGFFGKYPEAAVQLNQEDRAWKQHRPLWLHTNA